MATPQIPPTLSPSIGANTDSSTLQNNSTIAGRKCCCGKVGSFFNAHWGKIGLAILGIALIVFATLVFTSGVLNGLIALHQIAFTSLLVTNEVMKCINVALLLFGSILLTIATCSALASSCKRKKRTPALPPASLPVDNVVALPTAPINALPTTPIKAAVSRAPERLATPLLPKPSSEKTDFVTSIASPSTPTMFLFNPRSDEPRHATNLHSPLATALLHGPKLITSPIDASRSEKINQRNQTPYIKINMVARPEPLATLPNPSGPPSVLSTAMEAVKVPNPVNETPIVPLPAEITSQLSGNTVNEAPVVIPSAATTTVNESPLIVLHVEMIAPPAETAGRLSRVSHRRSQSSPAGMTAMAMQLTTTSSDHATVVFPKILSVFSPVKRTGRRKSIGNQPTNAMPTVPPASTSLLPPRESSISNPANGTESIIPPLAAPIVPIRAIRSITDTRRNPLDNPPTNAAPVIPPVAMPVRLPIGAPVNPSRRKSLGNLPSRFTPLASLAAAPIMPIAGIPASIPAKRKPDGFSLFATRPSKPAAPQ